MFNALVVDDDTKLCRLICTVLVKNGYQAFAAADGQQALKILDQEYIDIIISDVMMPKLDGYQLIEQLRRAGYEQPVLMITVRDSFTDKKRGFLAGIDDYMVKPIDVNEMILRVGALLRRAQIAHERRLTVGSTILDYDSLTVEEDGKPSQLPQKEFYLLFKLISYPGQTFTRRQLMDEIWGMDSDSDERTVDVHVNHLRDRFRDSRDFELQTVRGLGYRAVKK
ncbi:MAG: response regulator transcription factor [Clostridiales bacterium]